jgi:hypothetical protein
MSRRRTGSCSSALHDRRRDRRFPAALAVYPSAGASSVRARDGPDVESYEEIEIEKRGGRGRATRFFTVAMGVAAVERRDGREHVAALLSDDMRTVSQAVWSESR